MGEGDNGDEGDAGSEDPDDAEVKCRVRSVSDHADHRRPYGTHGGHRVRSRYAPRPRTRMRNAWQLISVLASVLAIAQPAGALSGMELKDTTAADRRREEHAGRQALQGGNCFLLNR